MVGQQRVIVNSTATTADWSTSLFSCDETECMDILLAWFCTPCFSAKTRTEYDTSNCFFNFMCATPVMVRNIIREGYGIEGSCILDIFYIAFCPCCSTLQQHREVKRRGPISKANTTHSDTWKHELFGCCANFSLFLYAYCCPMCAHASVREDYDGSNCFLNCMCGSAGLTRNVIREGYAIEGTCCDDILLSICCQPCEVSRLDREVKQRGSRKGQVHPA